MSDRYRLVPTVSFQADLERLEAHIVQRELASQTPDEDCLFRFQSALERAVGVLRFAPHSCRRCEADRTLRELVVPFGHGGCVVLFAIRDIDVLLLAARDQHEHDYR
ncbi:type II toxin-antitoxin system RelE/ParE family toxin [Inhella proteolytica]|uniref:Type II toxin-antitoxin system RelE/ParE family toxin n=1 Tax=Inhella proteolytica TaxID=2795029 RepID=A0A931NJ43_9BURK|nr:type II toxin-antitoxin system RelE/ParE family toxin [Inhella proteolytica]MBH9578644.1 type II toxin-antitoxin system RelE/ParE family toxin [Inhella proteolytica]